MPERTPTDRDVTVQTVLGPVPVDDLGVVLLHEHMFEDLAEALHDGARPFSAALRDARVTFVPTAFLPRLVEAGVPAAAAPALLTVNPAALFRTAARRSPHARAPTSR